MNWRSEYERWLGFQELDEELKQRLHTIERDSQELEDSFYKHLEFGTGGMRGIIGPGPNRMNKYTIRRAAEGLAKYIVLNGEKARQQGVVIAYDSRYKSSEFAMETAKVLGQHGIKSYVFESLRTTPELSHAVRELKAFSGVVITASHNPSIYNGFKIYGSDGAQYSSEEADQIVQLVNSTENELSIPVCSEQELKERGLLQMIGSKLDVEYLKKLQTIVTDPDRLKRNASNVSIVYTPLHGTGNVPVRNALTNAGFTNLQVVKEQELPDPSFSTVEFPNPEEASAFQLAMEYGHSVDADLLLATDPDADRMGAAVKNGSTYQLLTGNQTGAIMLHYLISQKKSQQTLTNNAVMLKTIVTSEFGREIAAAAGVETIDVLTGFKYISGQIKAFEENSQKTFLFGFEESYGYLISDFVRDKDAVQACLLLSEAAAFYKAQGKSLINLLDELFEQHGYFKEDLISLTLDGKAGVEKIQDILDYFRHGELAAIAGKRIAVIEDYLKQERVIIGTDEVEDISLPESNVLKYKLANDSWFCIRPSGTEPKVKFYFGVKEISKQASEGSLKDLENAVMEIAQNIISN